MVSFILIFMWLQYKITTKLYILVNSIGIKKLNSNNKNILYTYSYLFDRHIWLLYMFRVTIK